MLKEHGTILFVSVIGVACVIAAAFGSAIIGPSVSQNELREQLAGLARSECEQGLTYQEEQLEAVERQGRLVRFQVLVNEALIEVTHEVSASSPGKFPSIEHLGRLLDRVNTSFNDARAEARSVLPLPDCDRYPDLLPE